MEHLPTLIKPKTRTEKEIFSDLSSLCKSPGYVHAIANICFRDNVLSCFSKTEEKDIPPLYSMDRLIRTEISTLIGLMVKEKITYDIPNLDTMSDYIQKTDYLLKEMHDAISCSFLQHYNPEKPLEEPPDPEIYSNMLREAILYGGESAYTFQYLDFAFKKYKDDNKWLISHKNFSIQEAIDVFRAIINVHEEKIAVILRSLPHTSFDKLDTLSAYTFNIDDIRHRSTLDKTKIESILNAFTLPNYERNLKFCCASDFNATNATPLLKHDRNFILFQTYSLLEALYESPFYWLTDDKDYLPTAMQNRGKFTEDLCQTCLERVFGTKKVYKNVDIYLNKKNKIGEIDNLVLFGDRAIITQAKSKRLTLESRKGDSIKIADDFKKSVQNAYDQGLICAKHINNKKCKIIAANGQRIILPNELKEIYIFCTVSDHYPALNYQVKQFIKYEKTDTIHPPFVLDIFALDAMTEMLQSPLYFLSYVNRRVNYIDKISSWHEIDILSYHLKHNLWFNDENELIYIDSSFSPALDLAMLVRRVDGITGPSTPDGILTRFTSTTLHKIIKQIEFSQTSGSIDFGFLLLKIDEETFFKIDTAIKIISKRYKKDHTSHDVTIGIKSAHTGLTIHCNNDPIKVARTNLQEHAEFRKYSEKADTWFAICINPEDMTMRFGLSQNLKWKQDDLMDRKTKNLPSAININKPIQNIKRKRKIGRNDLCHCGSGKKFKKCCLGK